MNTKLVTSLELSRELKELGILQESEFYWYQFLGGKWDVVSPQRLEGVTNSKKERVSAFISGELVEILPKRLRVEGVMTKGNIFKKAKLYPMITKKDSTQWKIIWRSTTKYVIEEKAKGVLTDLFAQDENLAEAMGKMLAYLIKNNLIKR